MSWQVMACGIARFPGMPSERAPCQQKHPSSGQHRPRSHTEQADGQAYKATTTTTRSKRQARKTRWFEGEHDGKCTVEDRREATGSDGGKQAGLGERKVASCHHRRARTRQRRHLRKLRSTACTKPRGPGGRTEPIFISFPRGEAGVARVTPPSHCRCTPRSGVVWRRRHNLDAFRSVETTVRLFALAVSYLLRTRPRRGRRLAGAGGAAREAGRGKKITTRERQTRHTGCIRAAEAGAAAKNQKNSRRRSKNQRMLLACTLTYIYQHTSISHHVEGGASSARPWGGAGTRKSQQQYSTRSSSQRTAEKQVSKMYLSRTE